MIGLAIKLALGGLGRIRRGVGAASKWTARNPALAAIILLCLALAIAVWRIGSLNDKLDTANRGWAAETLAREQDRELYKAAQAEAARKQHEADQRVFAARAALNEKVDLAHGYNETARRDAVAAYADRNRVRCQATAAAGSESSRAGAPTVPGDPALPADPAETADMVAITRSDLDDLTTAAVQGAERHRYLEALIMDGWAIPEPEFAQ